VRQVSPVSLGLARTIILSARGDSVSLKATWDHVPTGPFARMGSAGVPDLPAIQTALNALLDSIVMPQQTGTGPGVPIPPNPPHLRGGRVSPTPIVAPRRRSVSMEYAAPMGLTARPRWTLEV